MVRARYQRRSSRSAVWALRLSIFALVLFILSVGGHRLGIIATPDLALLACLVLAFVVIALLLAMRGFSSLWYNGDKGGARSFWATMLALVLLVPYGLMGWLWFTSPSIHDVSTDFDRPPQFGEALRKRSGDMNPLDTVMTGDPLVQLSAYPDVAGKQYNAAPDRVLKGVERVVKGFGWTETGQPGPMGDDAEIIITARAHSPVLGLKSDVSIRLFDEGEVTYVDMRSVSLYGRNDMGLNAYYITTFLSELDRQMTVLPGEQQ